MAAQSPFIPISTPSFANRPDAKGLAPTRARARALAELNIEILCANSSQAKGRVERANRTLQDRLVKELRLENVCDIEAGNAFLPKFLQRFNERFALVAAKPENLHRPLNVKASRLNDILCHREQRHVSEQLTMSYDRKQIILERNEVSEGLGGKYVDLYDFQDGRLEVRWKGCPFPTVSSVRTDASATPPSSRTNASATHWRLSKRSRIANTRRG